jgi:hypothetical protein
MGEVYRRALVLQFAERMLALGCRFDDDGEIDVFRFYFPDGGPALRQSYGADQGQSLPS